MAMNMPEKRTRKHHHLKILPQYYQDVKEGVKTFEIRKNDRNYKVGDLLYLKEWFPQEELFSGSYIVRRVCYITSYEQKENFVVLGLDKWDQ